MGVIESTYKYDDQLGSQWDLKIHSLTGEETKLKFKVQTTNLPLPSLVVERKKSGETVYKSYNEVDDFSVTLRESPDFSTYKFFQSWQDLFYDRSKRVFKNFTNLASYQKSLYNVEVTFYKGTLIAFPDSTAIIPSEVYSLLNAKFDISSKTEFTIPTYSFYATNCKPINIDTVSLDYTGQPLLFTVHFKAEQINIKQI
jgi:hypothetical protein